MRLIDKTIETIDRVMDWTMKGSAAESFAKFTSLCVAGAVALIGAIYLPLSMIANSNNEKLSNRLYELDNNYTHVFNSVADCENAGYYRSECEASKAAAMDLTNDLGTTLDYDTASECAAHHGQCDDRSYTIPQITQVGDVTIVNQIPVSKHVPLVVAWQAARNDLDKAVPLYSGQKADQAVRFDGKTFRVDPR